MANTVEPPIRPDVSLEGDKEPLEPGSEIAVAENTNPAEPAEYPLQESSNDQASVEPIQPGKKKTQPPMATKPKKLLQRFEEFLIPALILFMLGNALAYALPDLAFAQPIVGIPLMVMFAGIIFCGINQTESRWIIRLDLWMMLLIAGSLYYNHFHFTPGPTDISNIAPLNNVTIMGTVVNQTSKNRLVLDVKTVNREKSSGSILVYLPAGEDHSTLEAGTRLLIQGNLETPFQSDIPGTFNQVEYLRGQHITAILKQPSRLIGFETSPEPLYALQRLTDNLKHQVADTFSESLPSPHAEVLGGIVLGDKAIPVDQGTKQAFIQTGLIHVLAASGMNVGIIAAAVLGLLTLLKVPYKTRIGVAMVAVAFYSLLTGLPPSIQRAATMLELALFLKMLNRELSPVFLLCIASALLVAINPDHVSSIGFQFSVLTTFGLVAMVPPLQEAIGYYITRWLAGLILVPLVAQLWIWPLSIAYFNQFPVHSVPLNIAALALITPLTIIGFTAGLLSLIVPMVAGWLCLPTRPLIDGLLAVVHWGNSMEWAQWSFASPEPWAITLFYLGLLVLVALCYRFKDWSFQRKALLSLLPVALLLGGLCLESNAAHSQTRIALLPLSTRHEAFLIQSPQANTHLLLIPESLRYYEARALADYLKHRNISRLSAVMLLPERQENGEYMASNNLAIAFKRTKVDMLLTQPNWAPPKSLPAKAFHVFPPSGAKLNLGHTLALEGQLSNLRLMQGHHCLLAVKQQTMHPNKTDATCGVQASLSTTQGTRLFSQSKLSAEKFYELVYNGKQVTVY